MSSTIMSIPHYVWRRWREGVFTAPVYTLTSYIHTNLLILNSYINYTPSVHNYIENKQCIWTCTHHNIKDVDVNILKLWDSWQGKKRERADGRRERGRKGERRKEGEREEKREGEREGRREREMENREGGRKGGRRKERRREVGMDMKLHKEESLCRSHGTK